ncbi:uncharacterized protein EV420DRAFT_1647382 [Desarmillaria tabescens]|uniref:Zn(2)-C6 fungal-type domain-containing protein n=1 Tax=Armillaria tabescens TaxID=1929756 RepID=A0AA39JTG4_ARMTA|nr:uncharacterized protein EV420DRAFT_1647382 [Desarmillaria tabescens]KAK0448484.1 hypothetical protein EV420DRAFT_1647382 [Desarmillaria tabescens]
MSTPFYNSLFLLAYLIENPPNSSGSAPLTNDWASEAFTHWSHLDTTWQENEAGFLSEEEWALLEDSLWCVLMDVDMEEVKNSIEDFNSLAAETTEHGVQVDLITMPGSPPASDDERSRTPHPADYLSQEPGLLCSVLEASNSPPLQDYVLEGIAPSLSTESIVEDTPTRSLHPHVQGHAVMALEVSGSTDAIISCAYGLGTSTVRYVDWRLLAAEGIPEEEVVIPAKHRRVEDSPPQLTAEEKGKGHAMASSSTPGLRRGCPHNIHEESASVTHKHGGLGEPIPKNAREIQSPDLRPIDLIIPDQDFGDYLGCQGTYFRCDIAHKFGHFMSTPCDACKKAKAQCCSVQSASTKCARCAIHKHDCLVDVNHEVNILEWVFVPQPSIVTEICEFLRRIHQEACRINASDRPIPSLHRAAHLDNANLVSELFEKAIVQNESLIDDEAIESNGEGEEGDDKAKESNGEGEDLDELED